MSVKELNNQDLKREYNVTIEAYKVTELYDEKLKELSKDLKLPGFRPGKVPTDVAKKHYNDQINSKILQELINNSVIEITKEKDLQPVDQPQITIEKFETNSDLIYNMKLEVFPKIMIKEINDIKLIKTKANVSEADIDEALINIIKSNKEYNKIEGKKAEKGNAVLIDYQGMLDNIPFEGGTGKNHQLVLGSNSFIPGFEDQLIGSKTGDEVLVKVRFPKEYHAPNLADKDAEFKVLVHEVQVGEDSAIDDKLAEKFGLKDLSELKDNIKKKLESDAEEISKNKMRKDLFDHLEKKCDFLLPESLVDQEFKSIWDNYLKDKEKNPVSDNRPEEEIKNEYMDLAKRRVKLGLYIAEVGKVNNVQIDQEDLKEAIFKQARGFPGQEHIIMDYYRKNPQALDMLRGPILEDKVVDNIISQIQIEEKFIPLTEFYDYARAA